jgi:hypothetical protein
MNWKRALAAAIIVYSACSAQAYAQANDAVKYVGAEVCAGCHQAQVERWKASHHALAMEKATPATVLGDFSGVSVENFGVISTFSRAGDKFLVRTDGPDGAPHDYEISLDHQTCKKSLSDFSVRDWLLVRGDLRDKFVLTIQTAPKILDLRCIYAFIPLDIHRF